LNNLVKAQKSRIGYMT